MVIVEHLYANNQLEDVTDPAQSQVKTSEHKSRERPPIGELLKELRGTRTLRQVEAHTGITNAYLSNLELGLKRPGLKTLAKLGTYYQVPLDHLLHVAGMGGDAPETVQQESVIDIQRAYGFVLGDPRVSLYPKPTETPTLDVQKFVVQMYQYFTGKKLI